MFGEARERRRGNISHVQNESEFLLPYFQQPVLLKGPLKKKKKSAIQHGEKKKEILQLPHAVANIQGKHSHRCAHQDRWL